MGWKHCRLALSRNIVLAHLQPFRQIPEKEINQYAADLIDCVRVGCKILVAIARTNAFDRVADSLNSKDGGSAYTDFRSRARGQWLMRDEHLDKRIAVFYDAEIL